MLLRPLKSWKTVVRPENIDSGKSEPITVTGCRKLFRRTAAAITDFEYLAAQYRAAVAIDSEEYQDSLSFGDYYRLGMTAEARDRMSCSIWPGSPYAAIREQQPSPFQQLPLHRRWMILTIYWSGG